MQRRRTPPIPLSLGSERRRAKRERFDSRGVWSSSTADSGARGGARYLQLFAVIFCTIVARNYLAQARVLAKSFTAHHPDRRLAVLVVDAEVGESFEPDGEPFELVRASQLPLPEDEFRIMAAIYDVTELSTAVKPALLRLLLERDGSGCCHATT